VSIAVRYCVLIHKARRHSSKHQWSSVCLKCVQSMAHVRVAAVEDAAAEQAAKSIAAQSAAAQSAAALHPAHNVQ